MGMILLPLVGLMAAVGVIGALQGVQAVRAAERRASTAAAIAALTLTVVALGAAWTFWPYAGGRVAAFGLVFRYAFTFLGQAAGVAVLAAVAASNGRPQAARVVRSASLLATLVSLPVYFWWGGDVIRLLHIDTFY